jgi:aspartate kinase
VIPEARLIPRLDYRLCSTLAHLGGRVLHARCVDLAARHRVPLEVRSSFEEGAGTIIEEDTMESAGISAIVHRDDCSIAIAEGNAGGRGEARGIIAAIAHAYPELELIAHERNSDTHGAIVWVGSRSDTESLRDNFRALRGPGGEWKLDVQHGVAFVSLVGIGLGAHEVVRAEEVLERAAVPLIALRTTPTALIFRVPGERCQEAVLALHREFIESGEVRNG